MFLLYWITELVICRFIHIFYLIHLLYSLLTRRQWLTPSQHHGLLLFIRIFIGDNVDRDTLRRDPNNRQKNTRGGVWMVEGKARRGEENSGLMMDPDRPAIVEYMRSQFSLFSQNWRENFYTLYTKQARIIRKINQYTQQRAYPRCVVTIVI